MHKIKKACLATFFGLLLIPCLAHAQNGTTASAMFGVTEVVVQNPSFADEDAAKACGVSRQNLMNILMKTLQENGVPAISVVEAKPPVVGVARISLLTNVYSFNGQSLDCTSWISLGAESHNRVHVAPVDVARNVTISYWREGSFLSGNQVGHGQTVMAALQKLALMFAQQYKLDNADAAH
jgi:hypothetical protein